MTSSKLNESRQSGEIHATLDFVHLSLSARSAPGSPHNMKYHFETMGYSGIQLFRNVARAVQLRGLSDGICPHVRVTHAKSGENPAPIAIVSDARADRKTCFGLCQHLTLSPQPAEDGIDSQLDTRGCHRPVPETNCTLCLYWLGVTPC
jgi:hypothetical protein